jgi:predicted AlkP superfamily phosphohydrolase/phosphomutase
MSERTPNGRQDGRPARKAIAIGVDGGSFRVINPLMAAGHLPNFARLAAEGARSTLTSTIPPLTPPAFASSMTGKNPGKHNIFDFARVPRDGYRRTVINSTHLKGNRIWNILNHYGYKTGVVHFPGSYPPEEIDGFMVGGILTPRGVDSHTYPKELAAELKRQIPGYRLYRGRQHLRGDLQDYLDDLVDVTRVHAVEALYLMEKKEWDFFFLMFKYTDSVQHIYWKFWDPTHPAYPGPNEFEDAMLRVYGEVDRFLGELLDRIDDDTTLLVFSDHGFMPIHTFIYMQNWLASEGFLTMKKKEQRRLNLLLAAHERGFRRDNLVGWLKRHNLAWLPKLFPEKVKNKVPASRLKMNEFAGFVDWKKTRAYQVAEAGRGVNLHVQGREPLGMVPAAGPEYDRLRDEIIARLKALRDPNTGETVVDQIWKKEDVYSGPYLADAPDVLIELKKGYCFAEGFGRGIFTKSAQKPFDKSANHELEGILFLHGPAVRAGFDQSALAPGDAPSVMDVTPTLLYAMGLPVQQNMDGRALVELYDPAYVAEHPVAFDQIPERDDSAAGYDYSDDELGSVEAELKSLGYL